MLSALTAIWTFLSTGVGKFLSILVIVLLLAAGIFYAGWTHGESHQQASDTSELTSMTKSLTDTTNVLKTLTAKVVAQNQAMQAAKRDSDSMVTNLQKQLQTALNKKPTIQTIIKEVPTYVPVNSSSNGLLTSVGFIQLYNSSTQSATGLTGPYAPSSPGVSADTPSGLMPDYVASVIVYNNTTCLRWRDQLVTWQQWYAAEKIIVDKANAAAKAQASQPAPAAATTGS
jgi:hypothetical protein